MLKILIIDRPQKTFFIYIVSSDILRENFSAMESLIHISCGHVFRDFESEAKTKEYKEEGQCAQKGGRMLVFVICGFIKNFLTNSYFILHIHHVKSFKMKHVRPLYFNFSVRYSSKCFKKVL